MLDPENPKKENNLQKFTDKEICWISSMSLVQNK